MEEPVLLRLFFRSLGILYPLEGPPNPTKREQSGGGRRSGGLPSAKGYLGAEAERARHRAGLVRRRP